MGMGSEAKDRSGAFVLDLLLDGRGTFDQCCDKKGLLNNSQLVFRAEFS